MIDIRESLSNDEVSGLTNEGGIEQASEPSRPSIQSPSAQEAALRWAEGLRNVASRAPLPSVLAAFLLGVWVARRL